MEPEPVADAETDLLPVRMLTEYVYCPRLFHLMHVEGRWEDNVFTVEGRFAHRREEEKDEVLPDPSPPDTPTEEVGGDPAPTIARLPRLAGHLISALLRARPH